MKSIVNVFVVLCLLLSTQLFVSLAHASNETDNAVSNLTQNLNGMKTLSAHFNQQVFDERGQLLQQAEGEVKLKRPLHFYWHTVQPYEHLLVTDGDILWLYDVDLEQISRKAFAAEVDQAPALLLSGEVAKINQQYIIRQEMSGEDITQFTLQPRVEGSLFRELTISFKAGKLATMSMLDSFDQRTRIGFSSVKVNQTLDDELFRFVVPDGVDVISDEP